MRNNRIIGVCAVLLLFGIALQTHAANAANSSTTPTTEDRRQMFRRGAQLWPVYCNTCHNARPPSEFSSMEWKMIMMHMRTQANLTAEDAEALLEYLRSSK